MKIIKEISIVTGKSYDPDECVHIANALQAFKYLSCGATLLDLFCGSENRLIFVFSRKDTRELYDKWCRHEL